MSEEVKMMSGMTCKCGNIIEITVPMYVTDEDDETFICKECFDKAREEIFKEKHGDIFEKYEKEIKKNLRKELGIAIKEFFDRQIKDIQESLGDNHSYTSLIKAIQYGLKVHLEEKLKGDREIPIMRKIEGDKVE